MAEYIEREKLGADFELCNKQNPRWTPQRVASLIAREPTADVVEVVRGRWEFDGSDFADIWKCSACGDDWFFEYDPRDEDTRVNYCPNCGARMDGE